jgi:hypothetical protein
MTVSQIDDAPPSDPQCGNLLESSLAHYVWIPLFVQTLMIAVKLAHSWRAAKRRGQQFIFPMYFWFLALLCPLWSEFEAC